MWQGFKTLKNYKWHELNYKWHDFGTLETTNGMIRNYKWHELNYNIANVVLC